MPEHERLSPAGIRAICDRLVSEAGGYLRNAVREAGLTCSVCAGPIAAGYLECRRCQLDRVEFDGLLADLVAPVAYGIKGAQSGNLMWMYKHPTYPVRRNRVLLTMLLLSALASHERCIEGALDREIDAWAVVPSTSDRQGEHPLRGVARAARFGYPEIGLSVNPQWSGDGRATAVGRFTVDDPGTARGSHVLVIDDTWATGAHSQSAALALRQVGAATVTIVVLARWLNPDDHGPTAEFIRRRLIGDFDPFVCPVSGQRC